jgi:hypothetical protein
MKKLFAALAVVFSCTAVQADPTLLGKWQSSKQLTMSFARDRAKLEDKTILFLDQMMGQLRLTFTQDHIVSVMPDWQSKTAEGKTSQLVGFSETHPYKVLGTTATQVVVSSIEPVTGRKAITVYNFVGENTMWVYLGEESFPELNIREYFVRIK